MRRIELGKRVLLGGVLATATLVVVGTESGVSAAPYAYAATVSPDLSDPVATLVDGKSLNQSVWVNFQRAVRACMANEGWVYTPVPLPPEQYWSETLPEDGSFDVVSEYKYLQKPSATTSSMIVADQSGPFLWALRRQTLSKYSDFNAHDGLNDGKFGSTAADTAGCEAAGRAAVTDPARDAMRQLAPAAATFEESTTNDPAVTSAEASWSTCMTTKGFAYSSVEEPSGDIAAKAYQLTAASAPATSFDTLQTQEQAVASASQTCLVSSGFNDVLNTVVEPSWDSFVSDHQALLLTAGGKVAGQ